MKLSHDFFNSFLESFDEAAVLVTSQGSIVGSNSRWKQYKEEESQIIASILKEFQKFSNHSLKPTKSNKISFNIRLGNKDYTVTHSPIVNSEMQHLFRISPCPSDGGEPFDNHYISEFLRNSPLAIGIHANEKIVFINNAAINLLGGEKAEDFLGKSIWDFVPRSRREEYAKRVKISTDEMGFLPPVEETFLKLDGTEIEVQVFGEHINFKGHSAALLAIIDITEWNKVQHKLEKTQNQAQIATFRIDKDGFISDCSPNMEKLMPQCHLERLNIKGIISSLPETEKERLFSFLQSQSATHDSLEFDFAYPASDSGKRHYQIRIEKFLQHNAEEFHGTLQDISEYTYYKNLALSQQSNLELAVWGAESGLWRWDLNKNELVTNQTLKELLGEDSIDINKAKNIFYHKLYPEDALIIRRQLYRHLKGQISRIDSTFRLRTKEGIKWILVRGKITERDDDGNPVMLSGIFQDITRWKKKEDTLKNLILKVSTETGDRFFHTLATELGRALQAQLVFVAQLRPGKRNQVSPLALSENGKPGKNMEYNLKATPCEKVMSEGYCLFQDDVQTLFPDDKLLVEMNIKAYAGTPLKDGDGNVIGLLVSLFKTPVKDADYVEMILNLFASRAASELERFQMEKVKKVISNLANAVHKSENLVNLYEVILNEISTIISCDNFYLGLLSADSTVMEMVFIRDGTIHSKQHALKETISRKVIESGKSAIFSQRQLHEYLGNNQGNHAIDQLQQWMGVPLINKNKTIGLLVFHSLDYENAFNKNDLVLLEFLAGQIALSIQSKRNNEELLKLYKALEQGPAGVMITDKSGKISFINSTFTKISGYSSDEIIGKYPNILKSGKTPPEIYANLWETILAGKEWGGEILNRKKNGDFYWEYLLISPLLNQSGEITNFISIREDISERKKLELQLQQSQKMELIGTLVGGIAHDFNNMLTSINGYAEMALMKIQENHPLYRAISTIHRVGLSAGQLTKQLLAFSRRQVYDPQILDVNEIITGSQKIFDRMLGEDISIERILEPDLPKIKGDPVQIEQILMNILINARDAIQKVQNHRSKMITIQTSVQMVDPNFQLEYPELETGTYINLRITDHGVGMDTETQKHIFEPFFTTKDKGKGTGLGLSTVYGIVKQNKGEIIVHSSLNEGTTFEILWPAATKQDEIKKSLSEEKKIQAGKEIILVIEDDDAVREYLVNILEELGYKVVEVSNGNKALIYLENTLNKPDLIISDIVMPGIHGKKLAEALLKLTPQAKILFISGYSNEELIKQGLLPDSIHFLEKPFSVKKLSHKLREVIDS